MTAPKRSNWRTVRLGDAGVTFGGLIGKSREDFGQGEGRFITFMDVMANVEIDGTRLAVVQTRPGERQNGVKPGDVLLNGSSETPDELAMASMVSQVVPSGTMLNSFCFGFRLSSQSEVDPKFLVYLLRGTPGRLALAGLAQGAIRYNLSKRQFLALTFEMPHIEEQRSIARALDDVSELASAQEALIAKKRDVLQGLTQELLSGRTRLLGFSGSWRETALSEVGVGVRGVGYNPDVDLASSRTPWTFELLRSNNVQDGQLALNDTQHVRQERVRSEQVLRRGDILICAANGSRQLVGKSAYVDLDATRRFTFGAFMAVFRADASKADAYFVSKLMQTQHYRNYIDVLLSGSSINNLSPKQVVTYVALTPPLAEQQAIASVLRDADAEIGGLEAQLAKTRAIKQGMMQELLTGRTRLPVGAVA